MCKGPEAHMKSSTGANRPGRKKQQAEGSTGPVPALCLERPTQNSLLHLGLLVDVRKDVNFVESQSELAQQRNDPGRQMQIFFKVSTYSGIH